MTAGRPAPGRDAATQKIGDYFASCMDEPTVEKAGIDLLWFGIFIVLVVEMAQITPPVGFNLFVLQGMTRHQITWIARHTLPMFFLMCVAVLMIWYFPQLVTLLPKHMKM